MIQRPGLVKAIQNDCRVIISGPANLAAMLNSLQMGFKGVRTRAIQRRLRDLEDLPAIGLAPAVAAMADATDDE